MVLGYMVFFVLFQLYGQWDFSTEFFGYMVILAIWSTLPGQNHGPYTYPKLGVHQIRSLEVGCMKTDSAQFSGEGFCVVLVSAPWARVPKLSCILLCHLIKLHCESSKPHRSHSTRCGPNSFVKWQTTALRVPWFAIFCCFSLWGARAPLSYRICPPAVPLQPFASHCCDCKWL